MRSDAVLLDFYEFHNMLISQFEFFVCLIALCYDIGCMVCL